MFQSLSHIYSLLAVIPYLPFAIIWLIIYYSSQRAQLPANVASRTKNKRVATRISMDATTFLLIGSDAVLFNKVFGSTFGFYFILLVFLLAFGALGNLQHRKRGSIQASRLIIIIWRIGFLALSAAYILLHVILLIL